MSKAEQELERLGIKLPKPRKPAGNYVGAKKMGNLVFVSGQPSTLALPTGEERTLRGRIGQDLILEEGYEAARISAMNCLALLKARIGDLDRVETVLKVVGYVNSADGFRQQPAVMNGFTDLLERVFGTERGLPARAAIAISVGGWWAVEADMIVGVAE